MAKTTKLASHTSAPIISPDQYIDLVTSLFMIQADPLRAEQQMAYMRGQFEYMGIGATKWYPMSKKIFAEHGMFTGKKLEAFVKGCYDQPYREVLYVGIEMMQRMLQHQNEAWIKILERCITTHSWWDSVDWLAKLVGIHFQNYPALQHPYCEKWIGSDNIWLQRAAIIHQLFYREETDQKLLFQLIKRRADHEDFFIRKACGWALRQYSKTNPKAVVAFVEKNKLSALTKKEALRLLVTK